MLAGQLRIDGIAATRAIGLMTTATNGVDLLAVRGVGAMGQRDHLVLVGRIPDIAGRLDTGRTGLRRRRRGRTAGCQHERSQADETDDHVVHSSSVSRTIRLAMYWATASVSASLMRSATVCMSPRSLVRSPAAYRRICSRV